MNDLILHHYDASPYSEKIRALMGYKGLRWRSVEMPMIAPKPDLAALTGGYRRAPVLQIGADIYCDSHLIAEVLDVQHPTPSIAATPGSRSDEAEAWVDGQLFWHAASLFMGRHAEALPDPFLADRGAMLGTQLTREQLKARLPAAEQAMDEALGFIDTELLAAEFVNGATPASADFALYATLWFARNGGLDLAPAPRLLAWFQRLAGMGHGERLAMSAAEALDIARNATPLALTPPATDTGLPGITVGSIIRIVPAHFGQESVTGELLAATERQLSLKYSSPHCGVLHLHYPRQGYRVELA